MEVSMSFLASLLTCLKMNKFDQEFKEYAKSLAKIQVCAVFLFASYSEKCVTQIYRALFWDASHVGVPVRNTDMATEN